MSLSATSASTRLTPGGAIRSRVNLVCGVLVLTALAFIPIGLAWPTVSDSGTVLGVDDIQPVRDSMWLLIMIAAVLGPLNAGAQAITVLMLVREKAAAIATGGAVLMIVGCVMEAVGVAGFAAAYFYASDPAITHDAATQVFDADYSSTTWTWRAIARLIHARSPYADDGSGGLPRAALGALARPGDHLTELAPAAP